MSANTPCYIEPPVASIELLIAVYPAALLTLYSVVTTSFPTVVTACSRPVYIAFVVMVAGVCVLAKKPTAKAVADCLGVVSHDALSRMLTHSCWTASLLMNALVNQALLSQTGSLLPSILILDDVLVPKPFARWIAGAYWDWDHAQHRRTVGHRIVVVVWTNGIIVVPVAFALWHKRYSPYFLGSHATFTTEHSQRFLNQFPSMRTLLAPLTQSETGTIHRDLTAMTTWQKALISKKAWVVIAEHAAMTGRRYRTKNELARCLIYRVVRKGLRCDYVTFDSWYASKENLNMLTRLRLIYVTAVPCSRNIDTTCRVRSGEHVTASKQRVDETAAMFATRDYVPYPQAGIRALRFMVGMSGLPHAAQLVVITRQDWHGFLRKILPKDHPIHTKHRPAPNVYLLTNAVGWSTYQIICSYRNRWKIECLFRDLKQHLGLGACHHRSLEAVTRHIALVLFAVVCLQFVRRRFVDTQPDAKISMTIGDVKKRLQSQVFISGRLIAKNGDIHAAEIKPMPRTIFERLLAPASSAVIGTFISMKLESPAIKEHYNDA